MNTSNLKMIGSFAKLIVGDFHTDQTVANIMQVHGIEAFIDTEWYSVSTMNAVLADIVEARRAIDSSFDMVTVGTAVAQNMPLPEGMSLENVILGGQTIVDQIYAGEPKCAIKATKLGDNHYQLAHFLPWPSGILYGNIAGFAKRLLPQGAEYEITKHPDYTEGDTPFILDIKWNG